MKGIRSRLATRGRTPAVVLLLLAALFAAMSYVSSTDVSANHPVLVEGNCDSPVPGLTIVPQAGGPASGGNSNASTSGGVCGDFDGDGRIGTAEDTDGADRIFGTLNAALGPGTGAAAGTGANFNGTITIVGHGRFAESLYIGLNFGTGGSNNPGNVTLEAAPGIHAEINAVLQGDPAGGNASRQGTFGIAIGYLAPAPGTAARVVTLRNLTIRNWDIGVWANNASRVVIDNCRFENNLNYGIRVSDTSRVVIHNTRVFATGFRVGGPTVAVSNGHGLTVEHSGQARVANSTFSQNIAAGVGNATASAANVVLYQVTAFLNASGTDVFNVTIATNPNFAQ